MRRAALIVGAGPAGCAAAIVLARAGAAATILERTRETGDALCGGFLSWRTLQTLETRGIDPDALNPARIARVRLFAAGRVIEAPLPRPALAVSRRRLDALLGRQAARLGAALERGVRIAAVDGASARTGDGAVLTPPALFLASGKHDVRGARRGPDPNAVPVIGVRARAAPSPALARRIGDAIELHAFRGGYAGVVLQEDGSANICLAASRDRLDAAGDPAGLLRALGHKLPALGERLAGLGGTDAVANVPYGWRARDGTPGLFRLGDQAAVIPSLAGEGIGIALATGSGAARAYLRGGAAAAAWQRRAARSLAAPMLVAGVARGVVERPAAVALAAPLLAGAPSLLRALARATRVPGGGSGGARGLLSPA